VWACGPEGNPLPDQYAWGPPCSTEEKTIYVWAKNASKLDLPEDVSFHMNPRCQLYFLFGRKDLGQIFGHRIIDKISTKSYRYKLKLH
jgi:hypothetical protein